MMQEVKKKISRGQIVNFQLFADPHLPACILKLYLRELPESLFPPKILTEMNKIMVNYPPELRSQVLCGLIAQLPDINKKVAHEIFSLFKVIVKYQHINRMNEKSLSIIFIHSLGIGSDLFTLILENINLLFHGDTTASFHPEGISIFNCPQDNIENESIEPLPITPTPPVTSPLILISSSTTPLEGIGTNNTEETDGSPVIVQSKKRSHNL
uniref:Rho-GAP domain-containing protein n=1 Tax=Arcella intermedia TaxID=1963864 RepID=A0A6B2LAZ6_9EUKA